MGILLVSYKKTELVMMVCLPSCNIGHLIYIRRIGRKLWQFCKKIPTPLSAFANKALPRSSLSPTSTTKNTLPWWYVFVTVGHVFWHACTSITILWQNQDSHTYAIVEVFHDITKIIITEVSTSMTTNHASQKCFRQGWPTRGIHRNGMSLTYRVRFWIW